MSILGSVLKVAGTIVEGTGKTIRDCVEVIEKENKAYKTSEEYKKTQAERQIYIDEIKDSWSRIVENSKELMKK